MASSSARAVASTGRGSSWCSGISLAIAPGMPALVMSSMRVMRETMIP